MKKSFLTIIIASIFSSCEYNYDIDKHFDRVFVPKVVLNSLITPDSAISGDLFWSKSINDSSAFKKVNDFQVKLFENGNIIFDDTGSDGTFKTQIYPKIGASYNIVISVPKYGEIKASTSIPSAISTFKSSYDGEKQSSSGARDGYRFYTISDITTPEQCRALWIKAETEFEDNITQKAYYFYMENAFCDQINTVRGDDTDISLRGSEISHNHFIRIPYKNISYALPLKFSIQSIIGRYIYTYIGDDEFGYPIWERLDIAVTNINLLIITPSDEYDKYHKSSYWQIYSHYVSDIPIFNEPSSVYSNIDNGLGIFAGYLIESKRHDIESTKI